MKSGSDIRRQGLSELSVATLADNAPAVKSLLKANPELAEVSYITPKLYRSKIFHWIYVGDSVLHLAAAGYRTEIVRLLLECGADPNAACNRRRSTPLHYAADGFITGPAWNAKQQVKTIDCLIAGGARIDIQDKNGATPLHRAVRTRCAKAVEFLLQAGCDPHISNNSGSTPFHLAVQNTGRGASGEPIAIHAQEQIVKIFLKFGLSPNNPGGSRKSVFASARSEKIRKLLLPRDKE